MQGQITLGCQREKHSLTLAVLEQGKYTVTLIEGDGIGPEISKSVKDIFAAANVR